MLQGPSREHLAGTDGLGRDVFARVLVATRASLWYALLSTALASALGITLGLLPSVMGRRSGRALTGLINMLVAFPGLILALFVAVVFGVGAAGAVVALGVAGAPALARLTNTLASSVAGPTTSPPPGCSASPRSRLLTRHILPNIAEPIVLNVTTAIGAALLAFSALSFLGLGVQPPFYDWGRMLNEGLGRIYVNPAGALAPGAAIVLAGLTFNLLGEGLAQVASGRARRSSRRSARHSRRRAGRRRAAIDDAGEHRARRRRLVRDVPDRHAATSTPSATSSSRFGVARSSASSASRARARRSPRWRSPSSCPIPAW